jgi:hypothetical protein
VPVFGAYWSTASMCIELVSGKRVYRGLMRSLSGYNHDSPEDVHGQQGEEETNKECPREWPWGTYCWITVSSPFFR